MPYIYRLLNSTGCTKMNKTSLVKFRQISQGLLSEVGYNGNSPGLKKVRIKEFLPAVYDLWEQLLWGTYSMDEKNEALRCKIICIKWSPRSIRIFCDHHSFPTFESENTFKKCLIRESLLYILHQFIIWTYPEFSSVLQY